LKRKGSYDDHDVSPRSTPKDSLAFSRDPDFPQMCGAAGMKTAWSVHFGRDAIHLESHLKLASIHAGK
jgi:hypothetical protein